MVEPLSLVRDWTFLFIFFYSCLYTPCLLVVGVNKCKQPTNVCDKRSRSSGRKSSQLFYPTASNLTETLFDSKLLIPTLSHPKIFPPYSPHFSLQPPLLPPPRMSEGRRRPRDGAHGSSLINLLVNHEYIELIRLLKLLS